MPELPEYGLHWIWMLSLVVGLAAGWVVHVLENREGR